MSKLSTEQANKQIGRRLVAIRSRAKVGQIDFATHLGVSARAYQNYERGEREIPGAFLTALYEAYGIDPLWVLIGPGDTPVLAADRPIEVFRLEIERAVDDWLRKQGKKLAKEKRDRLVQLLHERSVLSGSIEIKFLEAIAPLAAA